MLEDTQKEDCEELFLPDEISPIVRIKSDE